MAGRALRLALRAVRAHRRSYGRLGERSTWIAGLAVSALFLVVVGLAGR